MNPKPIEFLSRSQPAERQRAGRKPTRASTAWKSPMKTVWTAMVALVLAAYLWTAGRDTPIEVVTLSSSDIDHQFTAEAREAVLAGRPIPGMPRASRQLVRLVRNGEVTFYTVIAKDTHDQDGDVISLNIAYSGVIGPVTLTKKGESIHIPVVRGQVPPIEVVALTDGSGRNRVTAGIQTSSGVWHSRVLPEGARQLLPVMGVR